MEILLNESQPIPLHAIAAMIAITLGGIQLCMKKGGATHKLLGRVWVGLMLIISFSSVFIHEIKLWGAYSPIHLVSLLTIFFVVLAVYFARAGKIKRHKRAMVSLYVFAPVLTGLFTLLPGRVMNQVVFG